MFSFTQKNLFSQLEHNNNKELSQGGVKRINARVYKKICQYSLVMKKLGIMSEQEVLQLQESLKKTEQANSFHCR
jgi:hypothetical protein